ncbi:nitroreductase [Bifidobacterium ramosum]|uniref:Nitroreductase n=1 Tax=Bifidobacterium ramosum TaxID=1798158 RepID=A0A6L4X024_9BIFI|nr:nitroreductase family protein [Bifidobacterium ramosum]KAB8288022.1 nitroreductase [Bifidobacterium ramosum]NEG72079.1 nitroreductase [Bifidobacterium ramosum]
MKEKIISIVPSFLLISLREFWQTIVLYKDSILQNIRFDRNYSRLKTRTKTQAEARVIFFTHQIEKGLSHADFKYGFGKKIFLELPSRLADLESYDSLYTNNSVYCNALAALHEYVNRHQAIGFDLSWYSNQFSKEQWADIISYDGEIGKSVVITSKEKESNDILSFRELCLHRHSVREFSPQQVSVEEVLPALSLSMRTPSVCNRQPTRLHIITNPSTIAKALSIQGGINGYKNPPMLILITSDLSAFMTSYEHNEGYTDGGLFGMTLLYSLESYGFATCPLNTMFTRKKDSATRKLLNIPDNEILIMYIEVGHFAQRALTCRSTRFDISRIMTVHA